MSDIKRPGPRRRPRRAGVLGPGVALALVAGACASGEEGPTGGPRARAIAVAVTEVVTRQLDVTVRGTGTLEASLRVEVRPEVAGIVERVLFSEGQTVAAGRVLYALDDDALRSQVQAQRAALRAARVRLANARRELARRSELARRDLVTRSELDTLQTRFDEAVAAVSQLEAELRLARERLEETRIEAKSAGRISESLVDPGAYVTPGTHLATIYRADPLEMTFTLPERHVEAVRDGQPVTVTAEALPGQSFSGEVDYVSPAVSELSRDFVVKARIGNPDARLKPGLSAAARVTVASEPGKAVVPEAALVGTRTGYLVFVVEGDRARSRAVEVGLRRPGLASIREGLRPGERVVVRGHMRLSDGARVRVVDDQPGGRPPATAVRAADAQ